MVFLSARHEDPELCGMCHVQTAQLDGETNLKLRRAPDETVTMFSTSSDAVFNDIEFVVECEEPTEHFSKFTGKLVLGSSDQVSEEFESAAGRRHSQARSVIARPV